MTQFRTRQGNLMLFTPQPMDSWIGKEVLEDQRAGGYKDAATGKLLTQKQAKSYAAFCTRHTRRCHVGDKVDKYLRLVDKYQPRVFAEARIYVARFPEQVGDLLKQIKKVRKRIRKKRGRARQPKLKTPSSSGEAAPPEGPTPAPSPEHATKGGDADAASERRETVDADMPPDWGDSSGDDAAPSYDWVWGEAGRPSDRGDSPSHLALRPSEPGGRPPPQAQQLDSHTTEGGNVRLVPDVQWRGVQLIQEHMAKARAERDAF
ncbi:Pkd2l1 [Symbiodinium sp. CCMP2456]|nr:Pkd2l1 [Symbiodinium sp. CCMP2456]